MNKAGPRQNIVLGCGTDYTPEQLLPFVSTLRGAGFTGQAALVIYADQLKTLAAMAGRFAVTLVPIARQPAWLPPRLGSRLQNRGRIKSVHRAMASLLPPLFRAPRILQSLGMPLHYFFHIACSRYFIYYSWLHKRRHSCANVLLTDVRDVVFQADPFLYSNGGALYCYMDPAVSLGDEPINTEWMTTTYGEAYCADHHGKRIACSGTTMGDVSSILAYLRQMCLELIHALPGIAGLPGVDQAVHNYLLWEGRLPAAILCENGRHAVMTLKNADIGAFETDAEGRLLNLDGNPAPVLHQYDFHPGLARRIKREGSQVSAPEISIIMPLYNTAAYVGAAIESILAQTVRDFELLVVDDGSTDGGPDLVRAFADGRIRLLSGYPNGGPGAARNRGLSVARGRRIAFFDSDDLAAPGMLATLMECMDAEPGYEIVSAWYEGIDEAGRLNGRDFKPLIPPDKLAPSMLFSNCIPTSVLLMKRECLEGRTFDEHLEPVSDYDLWSRLLVAHKAKQLPRVLARYRTHPKSISYRKSDAAADCLQRIYSRQLARLGVDAGAEEIDLHARLITLTFGTTKETVLAAEKWLLKLDAANTAAGLYPAQPFRETLGDRWYAVCHSAGGNGFWTWRQFFASPLSKWISPAGKQRYHLFRLSARGAVKNLLHVTD